MNSRSTDVLVVGAGVSGLTTAVCLAEAGLAVTVTATRPPLQTTSAVAGAIWGPHLAESSERTGRWGEETLRVLRDLSADPATGVRIAHGVTAARAPLGPAVPQEIGALARARGAPASPVAGPSPAPGGPPPGGTGARRCGPADLPAPFTDGWAYRAPLVEMPVYLGYLRSRLERAGGHLRRGTVRSLAEAAREAGAPAVVNCTGTGARELAGDPGLVPVRGEAVVVANPGITGFFIGLPDETHELVYMFPHGATVVLGGTEVPGEDSLEADPAAAARILRDCAEIQPRLRGARVLAHRAGLRPARPRVRLEAAAGGPGAAGPGHSPGAPLIVHNYGHGGAGVTLSWGCAREVAALLARGGLG